jgi:hypothetical protein
MKMIKQLKGPIEREMTPQAIFWRPIAYFSATTRFAEDNLDDYRCVSYAIDDDVFELRTYRGQPQSTTSLYLPEETEDQPGILSFIDRFLEASTVPRISIAWKRGDAYRYGELTRAKDDRLLEKEAEILALKIASGSQGMIGSVAYIESQLPLFYSPSTIDNEPSSPSEERPRWQRTIDTVSRQGSPPSDLVKRGYAEPADSGIQVMKSGIDYLQSIGFLIATD